MHVFSLHSKCEFSFKNSSLKTLVVFHKNNFPLWFRSSFNFRGLNVLEDNIGCESFTVISIDFLLVYENKCYLQIYLHNCAYKIIDKQMINYLDVLKLMKMRSDKCCYSGIDISEETDLAKNNSSKECLVSCYWFFNYGLEFQNFVCNGCHGLMMFCLNTSNIAIIIVKGVDYCCIFYDNSISEATHLLENSVLGDCGYILIFFFFLDEKNL